jgi:hypothetical protein
MLFPVLMAMLPSKPSVIPNTQFSFSEGILSRGSRRRKSGSVRRRLPDGVVPASRNVEVRTDAATRTEGRL